MGIAVRWENKEKSLICMTCEGKWSLQDLHMILDQHDAMVNSVAHTVDTLWDMQHSGILPGGILSVRGRINRKNALNSGIIIVAGANAFAKTMLTMINQMLNQPLRLYFTETTDEAYILLENITERRHSQRYALA